MKLLSTSPLPNEPEELPGLYRFIANESYIVASFGGDNTVHVLSSRTGEVLQKQPFKGRDMIGGLVLDGDNVILTCATDANLYVYNIPSETIICSLPGSDGKGIYILKSIQCDTDNCIVAAFHDDGSMCIWDVRARKHLHTIKPHDELAHCCNVVGLKMMTSSSDGTCALSNWESGQIVWKKKLGEPEIWVDRKWVGNAVYAQTEWEGKVAAATKDGMLRVFDLESGTQLAEWQAADGMIQKLFPYDNWLISISWGELKIWCRKTYQLLNTIPIFDRVVTKHALTAGIIICCGRDATQEADRCGGDEGLKAWKISTEDGKESQSDSGVFHVGTPIRAARGLAELDDSRIAIGVLRGTIWYIEIWQV